MFFYSQDPLNVSSIRTIENQRNFEKAITAITVLDNCISEGEVFFRVDSSEKYGGVLQKLFTGVLNHNLSKIDPYIVSTLQCFINNKTNMYIGLIPLIKKVKDESLLDVILYQRDMNKIGWERVEVRDDTDYTNLIRPQIVNLFTSVNEITFYAQTPFKRCTFSMIALLKIIENTHIKKVIIGASGEKTWLSSLWKSGSNSIIQRYSDKNFEIWFESDSVGKRRRAYYHYIRIKRI